MFTSPQFKITSWKRVAIAIGIGALLWAIALLIFYLVAIMLPEYQGNEMDRQLDEVERHLIEQGILPATPDSGEIEIDLVE